MIKLGLSISTDDNKDDDDLPPLAETADSGETNKMEEID
jgi:hypothetical protein